MSTELSKCNGECINKCEIHTDENKRRDAIRQIKRYAISQILATIKYYLRLLKVAEIMLYIKA